LTHRCQVLNPRWRLVALLADIQAPALPFVNVSVIKINFPTDNFFLNVSASTLPARQFLRGRLRRLQEFVEELSEKINVLF
jgi:hypothetical protein